MSTVRTTASGARAARVWLALSLLTLVSWGLAMIDRDANEVSSDIEVVGVMAIAVVKGRLIVRHFMEVRDAPRWLRTFTDVWLVGLGATVVAMYLAA